MEHFIYMNERNPYNQESSIADDINKQAEKNPDDINTCIVDEIIITGNAFLPEYPKSICKNYKNWILYPQWV